MDLLTGFLIILGVLIFIVIYQSRREPFSLAMYIQRFIRLLGIVFQYGKNVGLCMTQQFRQINWNLTDESSSAETK